MFELEKIKTNILKLSHSIIISGLSYIYINNPNLIIKNLIFFISESYFLYDTIILLRAKKIDYPMINHHIITSCLLFSFYIGYYRMFFINIYYMGEMSNISIYINYHLIKTESSKDSILASSIFQLLWYSYYRIYQMTNILINNFQLFFQFPLNLLLIIYFMGWIWSFILYKQIYNERIYIMNKFKYSYDKYLRNV